ncbi:Protein TAPT1-like protein [Picochlorum sp. SENEW3]|nr:Protein TAPT1-like protein [Picochlorum sp. SENEW3]
MSDISMSEDQKPAPHDVEGTESSVLGPREGVAGEYFGQDTICEPLSAREERHIEDDAVSGDSLKKSSSTGRLTNLENPVNALGIGVDASENDVSSQSHVHRDTQVSERGHHGVPVLEHLEETTSCSAVGKVDRRMALTARESPKRTMSTTLEHANTFHGIVEDVTEKKRQGVLDSARDGSMLGAHEDVPCVDADVIVEKSDMYSRQGLNEFIHGEFVPEPVFHTTDVIWGQTERDRVYNALLYVPYHLERLLAFGNAICLNSFLGVFTVLPLRVAHVLWIMLTGACGVVRGRKQAHDKRAMLLRGDQIYDLICICIFSVMILFLWHIRAGAIYFWVKELTQEFLKLSVLHTALELGDKICCSFGVDVLEALAASCTLLSTNPTGRNYLHVASDAIVALVLLVAHAGVLLAQALVYGVAMNSKKNTLLALLIASNFTEIKGTVLKRFDPTKLFVLACQDIVERFHLYIIISFVLVEESIGLGQPLPSTRMMRQCLYVLFAEVIIDVTKHAVLGKFNDIRPGVYNEFTKDLCENLSTSQSHTMHKLVGIEPFASAALFFRVLVSFTDLQLEIFMKPMAWAGPFSSVMVFALIATTVIVLWITVAALTLMLGYVLKAIGTAFLTSYSQQRDKRLKKKKRVRVHPDVNVKTISVQNNDTKKDV